MSRYAILVGLGDYYGEFTFKYRPLQFVYKNIHDFQNQLIRWNWKVQTPIIDLAATKTNVLSKFREVIDGLERDDSMLFYFTGHGDRFFDQRLIQTFLVSAQEEKETADPRFDFDSYLNEVNYNGVIEALEKKDCHLITIIDCCYAMGLIDGYDTQRSFHTVIAASSENSKSFYDTNSLFFKAFSKSWNANTFLHLKTNIEKNMHDMNAPNRCKIFVAGNYQFESLKTINL